jgi:hypothetical protein
MEPVLAEEEAAGDSDDLFGDDEELDNSMADCLGNLVSKFRKISSTETDARS